MDAERGFIHIVLVAIDQAEFARDGEVHLVGGQGEFAANDAPDLHVNFRAVEGRLIRHLDVVDAGVLERFADHFFGLFPKLRFVDEFGVVASQARGIVGAETHDVFLDAEDFEILEIHFVDGIELLGELLWSAVDVGVVHVERAHAHEAEKFARLFVAVAGAIFGQAQWQVAVTARLRRKDAVVVRAVHGF